MDELLLNTLAKACRLVNDHVKTRLPIQAALLEMLLFELERIFNKQYYLEILYKTIFILAYYGLLRIGELTKSEHCLLAKDVQIGDNKEKILLTLHSSKTHGQGSKPQQIKISGVAQENVSNKVRCKNRFFCPFKLINKYFKLRGDYFKDNDQFFVFSDGSPVQPHHVRNVLSQLLQSLGKDHRLFSFYSFRIGRCTELIKLGYAIEIIKRLGRWKSNAVYRYIRD